MGEELFEGRPQCDDRRCPWCARSFFGWLRSRMAQMSMVRPERGETVSFAQAAATSVRPERNRMGENVELLRPIDFGSLDDNEDFGVPEGELMTLHEFVQAVDDGSFIDYDGFGVFASATHKSNRRVNPSDVPPPSAEARFQVTWYPAWATHVLWYNR